MRDGLPVGSNCVAIIIIIITIYAVAVEFSDVVDGARHSTPEGPHFLVGASKQIVQQCGCVFVWRLCIGGWAHTLAYVGACVYPNAHASMMMIICFLLCRFGSRHKPTVERAPQRSAYAISFADPSTAISDFLVCVCVLLFTRSCSRSLALLVCLIARSLEYTQPHIIRSANTIAIDRADQRERSVRARVRRARALVSVFLCVFKCVCTDNFQHTHTLAGERARVRACVHACEMLWSMVFTRLARQTGLARFRKSNTRARTHASILTRVRGIVPTSGNPNGQSKQKAQLPIF